jgi:hypothetical protein
MTVAAALLIPAAVGASEGRADTGTVVVKVRYDVPGGGTAPLDGVQVNLWKGDTEEAMWTCANAKGIARFTGVPANVSLTAWVTTVLGGSCSHTELLNPDDGKQMLVVNWNNNHGEADEYDFFQIDAGEKRKVKLRLKTPKNQKRICWGFLTTWVGSNGPDTYVGTPDADIINARGGDDIIKGMGGDDLICGGKGKDELYGNAGRDFLFGEQGSDRLFGGGGADDWLDGGPHRDVCKGENAFNCEA